MSRPSSDQTPQERPEGVWPYVLSSRLREAIEALDDAEPPPPGRSGRPLAAVVCDASSMEAYVGHCLRSHFEVVTVRDLDALAVVAGGVDLRLIAADLYTLEHQSVAALDLLEGLFHDVPLLVLSQEAGGRARLLNESGLDRSVVVVTLPTPTADIRRLAVSLAERAGPGEGEG
ncbi:hypothetical protein [Rubrivirga sp.]|uniref:hypothetical protein n=1 Tax=Rubrivirga sp. TaxID=1885344 RepID=UPI003B52BBB2